MLKENGVVVLPTDTIYGIAGVATNASVVNRIYDLRKRDINKPCIILIGEIADLEKFSITLSEKQKSAIGEYWPAEAGASAGPSTPVSIVLDCPDEKLSYLHRGTKTLAFRLPLPPSLRNLLKETGPLIAPSANVEGMPPARSITEAKKYFGDRVDLYVNGGEIKGEASKVIKLHKDGSINILRE